MKKTNWLQSSALVLLLALSTVLPAKVIDNYLDKNFPVLVPTVQKLERTKGVYTLPKEMKVAYPKKAVHEFLVFSGNLSGRFGGWQAVEAEDDDADCKLILTKEGVPASAQGYTLSVRKDGITVKARTTQGLFYGVVTLNQLISKNTTVRIPCCEITDYPSLEQRGIYLDLSWVSSATVAKFCKVIDNFGKLKINLLELNFGSNLPFSKNPFTKRSSSLSERDVKMLVDTARRNYIEIMPHLQLLTHETWLRAHPQYMEKITSRRTEPGAHNSTWDVCTCPNSKLAREVCDMAIKETIRMFKPKRFNLSLDEFELCQWKGCQFCGKDGHKVEDIVRECVHYVNLVKSLGVTPYVYQDAMLKERSKDSILAEPLMKAMPRTTGIAIWDYKAVPVREQLEIFKTEGFKERVGLSFCNTLTNAMTLPIAAKETGCQGCILTYWGFVHDLYTDPQKVNCNAAASTVINAEFCWNANIKNDFHKAAWDPAREYSMINSAWGMPFRRHGFKFASVPMAESCNGQFGLDDCYPMLDKELSGKIAAEAKRTIEGYKVNLTSEGKIAAIMLSGGNDDYSKTAVTIPINNTVRGLSLLLTAGIPENPGMFDYFHSKFMPELFTMRINYANGAKKNAKVCYRLHFNNWNSESSGALARFALRFKDKRGFAGSFYSYDWNNPLPQQKIASIELIPNLKKISASAGKDNKSKLVYTGVPSAVLAVSAWVPGKAFDDDVKIEAVLPEGIGTNSLKLENPNTVLSFKDGMPKNIRFGTEGSFTSPVTKSVVNYNGSKMLKVVIPPSKNDGKIPRIFLDVFMTPPEKIGAVFFNCSISDMTTINRCGAYMMNKAASKYRSTFLNNYRGPANSSSYYAIPASLFNVETTNTRQLLPQETDTLRWSIWFNTVKQPITVYIGEAGTAERAPRWLSLENRNAVE